MLSMVVKNQNRNSPLPDKNVKPNGNNSKSVKINNKKCNLQIDIDDENNDVFGLY